MSADSLRLVTWNVWFGEWKREHRQAALWAALDDLDPDLICLQEVVPEHLDGPEIEQRRSRGDWISDDSIYDYDVVMVSRSRPRHSKRVSLPTMMGRSLLLARLDVDPPLTLATVHLESTRSMHVMRMQQLELINSQLAGEANVVLVGDMNFAPDNPAQILLHDWRDAWAELRGDEPGFTVDSELNHMRGAFNPRPKRERIDRVLVRGQGWRVASIERLGVSACAADDPLTFVSDHFGLLAELRPA